MSTIRETLELRRRQNLIDQENRKNEVCAKENKICELVDLINAKNIERIFNLTNNGDVDKISSEIENLIEEKNKLLLENGFPLDYMDLRYHCDICKDTGTVGTNICSCTKKIQVENLYEQSEIRSAIEEENFDNFNLNVFRKDVQQGEEISPYENMKEQRDELYLYAKNFGRDSVSLYIYGPVGTGKTYMLNSIAKEVLDTGHSVIYLTESQLVNDVLEYKYAFSETKSSLRPKFNLINDCDLLIIDDLGSNTRNDSAKAALFEVLNTRLVKKLPVIISSNLDPEELRVAYDMRIYSRIIGMYYQRKFYGNDVRMR